MRNSSATEKKNSDVDAALPPRLPPATALSVPPHTPLPPFSCLSRRPGLTTGTSCPRHRQDEPAQPWAARLREEAQTCLSPSRTRRRRPAAGNLPVPSPAAGPTPPRPRPQSRPLPPAAQHSPAGLRPARRGALRPGPARPRRPGGFGAKREAALRRPCPVLPAAALRGARRGRRLTGRPRPCPRAGAGGS